MPKIIDSYNQKIKKSLETTHPIVNIGVSENPYEIYQKLMESGDRIQVIFSAGDDNGNLSYTENSITVILPYEELIKSAPSYEPRLKSHYMGVPIDVKVDKIDEENNFIYLRSGREVIDENMLKRMAIRELLSELEKGKTPRVMGRIVSVKENVAYVSILNLNILGVIRTKNWQKSYVRKLEDVTKPGDWSEFEVIGSRKDKGRQTSFKLSRTNLTNDPWTEVRDEYLQEDTVLTVRCIDKPDNKSYWWGLCDSIKDIYIMGDYNNHGTVTIMNGASYLCKVVKADREKHILKVIPFSMVNNQFANQGLVNYLKRGKEKGGIQNG